MRRKSKYIEKLKSQITELQEENQLIQEQYATLQREQAANAELHRQIEALQKQLGKSLFCITNIRWAVSINKLCLNSFSLPIVANCVCPKCNRLVQVLWYDSLILYIISEGAMLAVS